ncbi:MAG: hypothetical protein P4N60_12770 [Verrucomicrobiae bacterium]|nr:hypothetical protein [Verrucomicrobiae bacterium]
MKSKNISAASILAAVIAGAATGAFACGPFFPNTLLDAGDSAVLQPPSAGFEGELARMRLAPAKTRAVPPAEGQLLHEQATELEMSDLAAALKRKKVSSEEATVIMQAHLAERMKLNVYLDQRHQWSSYREWVYDTNGAAHLAEPTNPPPPFPPIAVTPGLPREFADYFAGAIAWHQDDTWTAQQSWERVLALPEGERHFKSVWAAFMLAKYHERLTNDFGDGEAMKHLEQVRSLAKAGFADSSGLAVASMGDEARIYLRRKGYESAIGLYLDQYAAGDRTALNSLRFTAAAALEETGATPEQLKSLAKNPRTQRVITAYLISRHPYASADGAATDPDAKRYFNGAVNWLKAVEAAQVKGVESAEEFALAAYQAGDMEAAQRWVNRAGGSAVARWLQAKLFLRAGKIDEAAGLLA